MITVDRNNLIKNKSVFLFVIFFSKAAVITQKKQLMLKKKD